MTAEGSQKGRVKLSVYLMYLSVFGVIPTACTAFGIMCSRSADVTEKFWLSFWGK